MADFDLLKELTPEKFGPVGEAVVKLLQELEQLRTENAKLKALHNIQNEVDSSKDDVEDEETLRNIIFDIDRFDISDKKLLPYSLRYGIGSLAYVFKENRLKGTSCILAMAKSANLYRAIVDFPWFRCEHDSITGRKAEAIVLVLVEDYFNIRFKNDDTIVARGSKLLRDVAWYQDIVSRMDQVRKCITYK